jgi:hypothetical protein
LVVTLTMVLFLNLGCCDSQCITCKSTPAAIQLNILEAQQHQQHVEM